MKVYYLVESVVGNVITFRRCSKGTGEGLTATGITSYITVTPNLTISNVILLSFAGYTFTNDEFPLGSVGVWYYPTGAV